jgi:hypothetical protein
LTQPWPDAVSPAPTAAFPALNEAEHACLQRWQAAAQSAGIDAVKDLLQRPWPCPVAETIIGIFKRGDDHAAWLVVGQAGQWAVACAADGGVSASLGSLAEALALVWPVAASQRSFD